MKNKKDLEKQILETLQKFHSGEFGYYMKPINNNTNIIVYLYDKNGIREINMKDWLRDKGLNTDKFHFNEIIENYKRIGIIKEIKNE